jgi:hypothetical protein
MPKAKKSSKKDTSAFIKKVASAGRGGDTELAYLSSTARDLLKKLGGAGTKNPKTKLKEYKAAARFAREPRVSRTAEESLDEFNRLDTMAQNPPAATQPLFGAAAAPAPTSLFTPTQPAAEPSPLSVRPDPASSPLMTPTQVFPGRATMQEEREPVARPGSAAQDMAAMRAAEERAAQAAREQQAAQEQAARAAQEQAARQQAERAAQEQTARQRAQEARAQEDLVRTRREEEGRRAEEQRRLAEAEAARRAQEQAAQAAAAQEAARQEAAQRAAQEQAAAERAAEIVRQQERERTAALIREQEERERAPRTEDNEAITTPGTAAGDLAQFTNPSTTPTLTPEQLAELAKINAAGFGNLTTGINMSGIGLGGSYMPGGPTTGTQTQFDEEAQRRAAEEEAARRAAEEEANRRAAEEAAKRAAEEAARKAAEEAARKAAEQEAARRAAEEEAARRAEEARRVAEQDAAARRAAEEARRVGEEAEKRRLADEAARKAAEDEARRRAEDEARRREEEKNRGGGGTPGGPGGGVTKPPGLIDSPLPTTPPATKPPPSGGGIQQPPPTTGGGTVPGAGDARTADFIDRNLNGIDDRDEVPTGGGKPPTKDEPPVRDVPIVGGPARPRPGSGFNYGSIFGEDTDIGRLISRIGRGRGRGGGGGGGGGGKIPELPPTGGGLPARPGPGPVTPPVTNPPVGGPPGGGGFFTPTPVVTPGYQAAPLPTMPGAGTGTPFFNPNTGGLTPGTVPTGQTPTSLATSNIPLQTLAANPNLGPTMLGGAENAGYYTDRFGNVILSPGAVKPPGRKKGGPSNQEELMQLLQEQTESEGYRDIDSARAMLDRLSSEPASSKTEVSLSPIAQSVRRTSRTPIRAETDRGTAKGMAMELEELMQYKPQGPRTKGQTEALRQKMELIRDTLGMPTFSRANLSREGDLMAKRFNEGGEVDDSTPLQRRIYMESVGDPAKATAPITEKSLSAKELDKLRKLIDIAERNPALSEKTGKPMPGVVDYAHQRMLMEQVDPMGSFPISMRDSDYNTLESGNLRNTLGQFTFERLPDGSFVVRDRYDYTGDVGERLNPLIKYANKKGVNRPVEIRLPAGPKKR